MAKHKLQQGMLISSSPDRISKLKALARFINSSINIIKISGVWEGGKGRLLFHRLVSTYEYFKNNTVCVWGPSWWHKQIKKWDLEVQRKLRTAAAGFHTCKTLCENSVGFCKEGLGRCYYPDNTGKNSRMVNTDQLHQIYPQTSAQLRWGLGYNTSSFEN